MAVVWRGFDAQLKRIVAVKVLHGHLHGREEIRKRFAREAQAVARLHHPHILDVYDSSGPEAEPSWLVMEFIRGTTLRSFADAHPFDPPELAAACIVPLAEALDHAHAAGVIHRDVKPENVMLREDGLVKLTDFGIAAIVEPDEKFTATGQILGSPAHLAPEIIEGRPASPHSDLFSLGTILYWLCCGQLPFRAPTPASLLRLIMECKPVDPRMVRPSVSDRLAAATMRCLAREPEKRFAGTGELARELIALLAEEGIDKPREELVAFVQAAQPEEYAQALRARLVAHSLERGEEALAMRRTSQALAAFSRALALEPKNERASSQVQRIHRRSRTVRLLRRSALGASLALLAGVGGTQASSRWRQPALTQPFAGTEGATGGTAAGVPGLAPGPTGFAAGALGATVTLGATGTPGAAPTAEARADAGITEIIESKSDATKANPPPRRPRRSPEKKLVRADPPLEKSREAAPRAAQSIPVQITFPLPASLSVDGQELGTEKAFNVALGAGVHRFIVRKDGFQDRMDTFEVFPSRHEYRLSLGNPLPARVSVARAPAEALVKLDGALLGTVEELLRNPDLGMVSMSAPTKDVKITVGDRSFSWRIKAGQKQVFDYEKNLAGAP
jgi:hypothetical protein